MIALRQWGERWETCVPAFPILVDARDRRPLQPVSVRSHDGRVLGKGDLIWALPGEVAVDGVEAEAADGFNICPAALPVGLEDFAAQVVPELQRRGMFRTEYASRTLRGNLGVPVPASRYGGAVVPAR